MDLGSESMLVAMVGGESQRNGNCKNDNDVNSCSNIEGEEEDEGEGEGEAVATEEAAAAAADADTAAATRSATKGFGLKKWRRIRRKDQFKETVNRKETQEKDSDSESSGRMLKRVLNENEKEKEKEKEKENEKDVSASGFVVGSTSNYNNNDNCDEDHTHTTHTRTRTHTRLSSSSSKSVKDKLPHRKNNNAIGKQLKSLDPPKKPRESSPLSSLESDSRSSTASVFIRFTGDQIPITTTTTPPPPPPPNPLSFGTDCDPLLQSIFMLQSVQVALQTGFVTYF